MASQVRIVEGDLLLQDVEAIVNAWNRNVIPHWLLLTQGVSGAIKRAAGSAPFEELARTGPMALGDARATGAGRLPFKAILHVAGIDLLWRSSERSVLLAARNALTLADEMGLASVAFPAIGAGSEIAGRAIWGLTATRSLALIEDEARRSAYRGQVVLVRYASPPAFDETN